MNETIVELCEVVDCNKPKSKQLCPVHCKEGKLLLYKFLDYLHFRKNDTLITKVFLFKHLSIFGPINHNVIKKKKLLVKTPNLGALSLAKLSVMIARFKEYVQKHAANVMVNMHL